MTTKKQRREATAAKTAETNEKLRLENLEKLYRSQDRKAQKEFEKNRLEAKRKAKAVYDAKKAKQDEDIPENLRDSVEAAS